MPVTLPLEIYETFEEKFGKTDARKLVKSFETAISDVTEYKWAVTRDELFSRLASKEEVHRLEKEISKLATTTKEEIGKLATTTKEEIGKLATKEELNRLATKEEIGKLATKEIIGTLATKVELAELRAEMKEMFSELVRRIEAHELKIANELLKFDRKFTIMLVVMFFTIIFINQNSLELVIKLFTMLFK
jgi:hypothetical protein